jgi:hypothetical protein
MNQIKNVIHLAVLLTFLLSVFPKAYAVNSHNLTQNDPPVWEINCTGFEDFMSAMIVLKVNGVRTSDPNNIIGAFVGNNCRGESSPLEWPIGSGDSLYSLDICGSNGELVTFQVYLAVYGIVLQASEQTNISLSGGGWGNLFAPQELNVTLTQPPIVFNLTGQGSYCSGSPASGSVTLDGSETEVDYQLFMNGTEQGSSQPGTGSPIVWDNLSAGIYSVIATKQNVNPTAMNGTPEIIEYALPVVSQNPFIPVCINQSPFILTGGSPPGGTYYGTGITDNTFYPENAGVGIFPITYTYLDVNGCEASVTENLAVNGLPNVIFNPINPNPVCVNAQNPVALFATPLGGSFTGTGVVGNEFFPITAGAGNHLITYNYTDPNGCGGEAYQYIAVINLPALFDIIGGGSYCEGGNGVEIGLDGSETGIDYELYLNTEPTGNIISGDGSAINFGYLTQPGVYTVKAINNCGDIGMNGSSTVTINPLPAVFEVTGGGSYCEGAEPSGSITLSGSQLNVEYQLNKDGDPYDSPKPGTGSAIVWDYLPSGLYTLIASNSCGTVEMENTVTVTVNPGPVVQFDPLLPVCNNAAVVNLYATPEGGTFIGDGLTGNLFNPVNVTPGVHQITYNYTDNNGCIGSASQSITVFDLPQTEINISNYSICPGGATNLIIQTIGGTAPFTYTINPNVSITTGENPVTIELMPSETTVYSFSNVMDANGCSVDYNQNFSIDVIPLANPYQVEGGGNYCYGTNEFEISLNGSQTGCTYKLFKDEVSLIAEVVGTGDPIPFIVNEIGTYTIKAFNSMNCESLMQGVAVITMGSQIVVSAGQDIFIAPGSSVQLQGSVSGGSGNFTYLWSPSNQVDNPATLDPIATPASLPATFTLEVTDSQGCSASDDVIINLSNGSNSMISGIITYYNSSYPLPNVTIELLDADGQVVETTISNQDGSYSFSDLEGGNYSVRCQSTQPWGGGNSADGLLMIRHFTGHSILSGLPLLAADVSHDGYINAYDGLMVLKRFSSLIDSFPSGDWVFESPSFTVNGYNSISLPVSGLCFGDVNGSFIP